MSTLRTRIPVLLVTALGALVLSALPAFAQFGPPATVFGSVADEDGPVEAGLRVEAYVGTTLCGAGATEFTGDGAARVTVYWVDVRSAEQTAGCGRDGTEVRVKIGDRFAPQTTLWRAGPVRLDVTFGDVEPLPIPTFTPTPPRATPAGGSTPPVTGQTPTVDATPLPQATETPGADPSATASTVASSTSTNGAVSRPGGLDTASNQGGDGGGDGGFPAWGVILILLGVLSGAGAAGGIVFARRNRAADDTTDTTTQE